MRIWTPRAKHEMSKIFTYTPTTRCITDLNCVNPLMANDAFKRHKRFHILEKAQFSQKKVQRCENHQICRADFGEKNPNFFGAPPVLKRTHGGCTRGVSPLAAGFEGTLLALIIALVWLLRGHRLHQFVSLGGS